MVWCYVKGADVFEIEAFFDQATEEFVVRFDAGPERHQVERFKDEIAFRNRLDALEQEFVAQQWERRIGPPTTFKDGWKL